jgi:hypothetical protein
VIGRAVPRRGERGSVLALVPAAFLVLLLLGALAVDSGAAFLGQRDLSSSIQTAAADAAGAGISPGAFYGQGAVTIDPTQAAAVVCQDMVAQGNQNLLDPTVAMAVEGPAVFLQAHAQVKAVFGSIVPGFGRRTVSAEAVAVAAEAAGQPTPVPPAPAAYSALPC